MNRVLKERYEFTVVPLNTIWVEEMSWTKF